ncbi:Transcription factor bHLH [Abeliophyllum distichum]|uniref:Transcription factor bHLH n=1 Tax=Abeliophyllum distichum TaxID=126358 RepID=A0ABD1VX38_9LAMI
MVFPFSHKLQERDQTDPNLQMMGLGLSSQGMDWKHSVLSQVSSNGTTGTNFQMDSAAYGLLLSDNQPQQSTYENPAMNYPDRTQRAMTLAPVNCYLLGLSFRRF